MELTGFFRAFSGQRKNKVNEELRQIAIEAGAPEDVLNKLWFNIFCLKFAHMLLELAEEEYK